MCNNGSVWPTVVCVILVVAKFIFPFVNAAATLPNIPPTSPPNTTKEGRDNISDVSSILPSLTIPGMKFNDSILPQCSTNETLYNCTSKDQCCQSNGDVLVTQLKEIKERFQGVDSTIRKDYENIEGIAKEGLAAAKTSLSALLDKDYGILFPSFNKSVHILFQILVGFGKPNDLDATTQSLPRQLLHKILARSNGTRKSFPRTIKGITIFWDLNTVQKSCVVDYMIRSTSFGLLVDEVVEGTRDSAQSMHEYMSLLGSMVKIIRNMRESQQTEQCIEKIVKMQQCSICTNTSVCPAFYKQLLSGCIPQLEELYSRWDPLMVAMSQLTLRLCEVDLRTAYQGVVRIAEYVAAGRLNDLIYQHGVLAYMKCVQPDSHKRSSSSYYGRSEENMIPEEELSAVPAKLLDESYVYTPSKNSLIDDISVKLLRRRSLKDSELKTDPGNVIAEDTETKEQPTPAHPTTSAVDHLTVCREKLDLSFPPLELGSSTSLLKVSISILDTGCWNGTSVGSYTLDDTETTQLTGLPQALAIKELDEKMCRYTQECPSAEEIRGKPFNNSHYGPSVLRMLASLVPSLYFYCC